MIGEVEDKEESETINELALAALKRIIQNAEIAVDLHSAVYMFHFAQAVIKHISVKEAYTIYVGEDKKMQRETFFFE